MVDAVNLVKQFFSSFLPDFVAYPRKRRAPVDDIEVIVNPKMRRISSSPISYMDDDWHSANSNRYSSLRSSGVTPKMKPSWSKENVTVNIDDDDDVIEISKSKRCDKIAKDRCTSTPNISTLPRLSFPRNVDDEVLFMKMTKSFQEKALNAKTHGFEYVKPMQYLNENKRVTNGFSPTSLNNGKIEKRKVQSKPPMKNALLNQSFKLDEKEIYKKLLGTTTTSRVWNALAKYNTKPFFSSDMSRGKKMVSMSNQGRYKNLPAVPVIDLTAGGYACKPKLRLSTKEKIAKVLNDFDNNEAVTIKDSDSEVEVLPPPPFPKPDIQVERVNSVQKILCTFDFVNHSWLRKTIKNHQEKIQNSAQEILEREEQKKKLSLITSQIRSQRLEDQVETCLKIRDAVIPVSLEVEDALPELTEDDEARIDVALHKRGNPNEVLVSKFNLNITRRDIQTLAGLNWLNDEVINFYMNLIIERGKDSKWPKAYAMNTFFYPKLQKDGPASLRRWTRRVDIFAHDVVAVPIHLGVHWCMSIIDFRSHCIKYYDSMGSSNRQCLETLLNYLQAEHLDKKQKEYDISDWCLESVADIPQQMNGSDCGMFSCTFAEYLTRNARISFSQENMPYFRRKMVLEILNGELLLI